MSHRTRKGILFFLTLVGVALLVIAPTATQQDESACTIDVSLTESIQGAIDQVEPGAVICLEAGIWQDTVSIDKDLTLRGVDSEETAIETPGESSDPVVRVASENSIQVEISDVTIREGKRGLEIAGTAHVSLAESVISENGSGIFLTDSAEAVINNNRIVGNQQSGITSYSDGAVKGKSNEMLNNGVDLRGNVPGKLREPLVEASENEVVYPNEDYPTLQHAVDALQPGGTLILQGGRHKSGATITKKMELTPPPRKGATLEARSSTALSVVGGANLTATELKVEDGDDGMVLGSDAQADLSDITITFTEVGVRLVGSAQATISNGKILKNESDGIDLDGSAQVEIIGSTLSENLIAIEPKGTAHARIINSTISNNSWVSIAEDSANIEITGCTIGANSDFSGILLENSSKITATSSKFSGDGNISLAHSARATVSDSTFDGSHISLGDSSTAKVSDSVFSALQGPGISLSGSAQAEVTGNTFSGATGAITLVNSSSATIISNNISESLDGILLRGSARATINDNNITANDNYGVTLFETPCFQHSEASFGGMVSGSENTIPSPEDPNGNANGAVCPDELDFLMSEEGGELDRRK